MISWFLVVKFSVSKLNILCSLLNLLFRYILEALTVKLYFDKNSAVEYGQIVCVCYFLIKVKDYQRVCSWNYLILLCS